MNKIVSKNSIALNNNLGMKNSLLIMVKGL